MDGGDGNLLGESCVLGESRRRERVVFSRTTAVVSKRESCSSDLKHGIEGVIQTASLSLFAMNSRYREDVSPTPPVWNLQNTTLEMPRHRNNLQFRTCRGCGGWGRSSEELATSASFCRYKAPTHLSHHDAETPLLVRGLTTRVWRGKRVHDGIYRRWGERESIFFQIATTT